MQLLPIAQPPYSFRSPLDAFEQALEHEKEVTAHIHELYDLAMQEKDYPAKILLDWFVQEQVEEEKSATEDTISIVAASRLRTRKRMLGLR